MKNFITFYCFLSILIFCSCGGGTEVSQTSEKKTIAKFNELSPEKTGISFANTFDENSLKNPFNYINVYNGSGVAIGDINNDGLQDVFLGGNTVKSRLYLNKGDMKFEDITEQSKIDDGGGWVTSVTMADINNDGWLDIYLCRSYHDDPAKRENLFYWNKKDGTFEEMGSKIGINDPNYSIAASFFDYDRDGDLDLIVANHPRYRTVPLATHINYNLRPVKEFSSRLFRNDRTGYTEVTDEAGILSYGFCLAVSTSDFNSDGYPDIYLTVDHDEGDILYQNNQDGTFTNVTKSALKLVAQSAMGIDAGDLNHDTHPDYFVVEMLPTDYYKDKVTMGMATIPRYRFLTDTVGYPYYSMRNFMYLNNGNGKFSDIAQMSKIHKSDWSWSALFMDMDNDSWQDLFIANGYYRDIYNQDRMKPFDKKMAELGTDMETKNKLAKDYTLASPIDKVENFFYQNNGDLTFSNRSTEVGLLSETVSTGAAYGDLDNDGDLDLVVNNVNAICSVIENVNTSGNNWLRINFNPDVRSINPLGSKAIIKVGEETQFREILTTRGFQGSSEPFAHFGLGSADKVDELQVIWPDGKKQILNDVAVNQLLNVNYSEATGMETYRNVKAGLVNEISSAQSGIDFQHQEKFYDDYEDQILLPHKMSEQGPFISEGDVNNDDLSDFYVGAGTEQVGALYIQLESGKFARKSTSAFVKDKKCEDSGSAFFDVDADGDLDLVVAGAGYQFEADSPLYQPRLYLNDGKGNFTAAANKLPKWTNSGSCVRPVDIDNDGDTDFFIGGLLSPKRYPEAGKSAIFINQGKGQFDIYTDTTFTDLGMVKDAIWTDLNQDKQADLIVVGEWTPISFFINQNGKLVNKTEEYLPNSPQGWWNCIEAADFDGNGLQDFAVGNLGLNYKYKASFEKPFKVYGNDMDENGTFDIILSSYYGEKLFPVRGKTCSSEQIPDVKNNFPTYHDFSMAEVADIYGEDLNASLELEVTEFQSVIIYQYELGKFSLKPLPFIAQKAPINSIVVDDVDSDGKKDIIIAGNLFQSEIETGRAISGTGQILLNTGNKTWKALSVQETGLCVDKDVKSMKLLNIGDARRSWIVVGNNNDSLQIVEISKKKKVL